VAQRVEEAAVPWPVGTADALGPAQFRFGDGTLRLAYTNMSGANCEVEFRGVAGLRWTADTGTFQGLRDDFVYEVMESDWVRSVRALNLTGEGQKLRHLIIGFNEESSWLEVVFESWATIR
jgi:hypothetical protein